MNNSVLRTVGMILAVIGALASALFALLFVVLSLYVGMYGWGIVAAIVYALPALFLSLCIFAVGRYISKHAEKKASTNKDNFCVPAYPPSHLLPAKKELS